MSQPAHPHDHSACQRLLASIGDYVEGEINLELCQEIERHLSGCENCRIVVDTLSKTIYLYQANAQDTTVPGAVRDRLFSTLKLDAILPRKP
jgi:predicted anti-sigma-YlaC factor YlaD